MANPSLLLVLLFFGTIVALFAFRIVRNWRANAQITRRARRITTRETGQLPRDHEEKSSSGSRLQRFRDQFESTFGFFESEAINQRLLSANWNLTGTEYYLIQFGGTFISFVLIGLIFSRSVIVGTGLAMLAYITPQFLLARRIESQNAKFENQLIDVLNLIRGAVRSGYSLLQSLDVVVQELPPPASIEFGRVQTEVSLGLSLRQALQNLTIRRPNDDLKLVVTAININNQVGGNLSRMLDAVIGTLRDRSRILGEIRAITAYARYSSYVLTLLPVGMVGLLFVLNPDYISQIFEPGPYLIIPIAAFVMIILGNIWLRIIGRIEV